MRKELSYFRIKQPKIFQFDDCLHHVHKLLLQFFMFTTLVIGSSIFLNKKHFQSANSKGYAFILFEDAEVAKIVANTMNDYILCGRLLKCK